LFVDFKEVKTGEHLFVNQPFALKFPVKAISDFKDTYFWELDEESGTWDHERQIFSDNVTSGFY
jgi:hypothetical protein